MTRRTVWAGACVFVALVLATLCALLPITVMSSSASWTPTKGQPSTTPMRLAAVTPQQLTADFPCQALRDAIGVGGAKPLLWTDVNDYGPTGLGMSGQGGRLWVTAAGQPVDKAVISIPAGPCTIRLSYDQRIHVASLTQVGHGATGGLPASAGGLIGPPTVTGLWAEPKLVPGVSVEVGTQVAQIQTPWWRWALSIGALLLVLTAMVLLRRESVVDGPKGAATTSTASTKWCLTDTVVAILLAIASVIVPPNFDDGWVLATVRQFRELGFFSNYYTMNASAQPQGFWWAWLEHFWFDGTGTPAFALRVPCALLLLWTWWFLRRRVLDLVAPGSRSARALAGAAFLTGSFAYLITLRPEPLVALLLCVQLALVIRYSQRQDPWLLAAMGINGAMALAAHQAGWTVIMCAAGALPAFRDWMARKPNWSVAGFVLVAVGASISTAVTLLMLGTNWQQWMHSVQAFSADPAYQSLFNESERVSGLFDSLETGAGRIFFAGLIMLSLVAYFTRRDRKPKLPAVAGWAAVASTTGLLLTSSKLSNHIGVLTPAAALLTAITVADLREKDVYSRVRVGLLSLGLAVCGYVSVHPLFTGSRNTDLLGERSSLNSEYPWRFFSADSIWFWVVLIGAVLTLGYLLVPQGQRVRVVAVVTTATVCSVCIGLSLAPVIAESGQDESWIGQQVSALSGKGCGLAGPGGLVIPTAISISNPIKPSPSPTPLIRADTAATGIPIQGPFVGVPTYTVSPGTSGVANSPWFALGNIQRPEIWTRGGYGGLTTFTINYLDEVGGLHSSTQSRPSQPNTWQVQQFDLPAEARQLQISWNSTAGPASITAPWSPSTSTDMVTASESRPVWAGPDVYLQAPCVTLPSIASGIVAPFDWSLGTPVYMGATPGAQLREMDCPGTSSTRWIRCAVAVTNPAPSNYTLASLTRKQ